MTKINSMHSSTDLDSVGRFFDLGPFAFCLPQMQMQCLEVSQASCKLEDEIHMLSMKEHKDGSRDSQQHC